MKEQDKVRIANKNFGKILKDGFKLFKENYLKLIIPFALFYVIVIVLQVFLLTDLTLISISVGRNLDTTDTSQSNINKIMNFLILSALVELGNTLIGAIFGVIIMCFVSGFLYKEYIGEETDFNKEFKKAINPKMIKVILLLGVVMSFALNSLFLTIPGVIIFIFFIFTVFTYNMKDIEKPISNAISLSKPAIFKIMAVFIVCYLLTSMIAELIWEVVYFSWFSFVGESTINSWYDPSTRNWGMIILFMLSLSIGYILVAPLFICLITPLFAQQKARYELNFDHKSKKNLYPDLYSDTPPAYAEPHKHQFKQSKPKGDEIKGIFCPFCGYKNEVPKKFCPECGEALDFK